MPGNQSDRYARLLTRETRRATPQESPMVARAAAGAASRSNLSVVTQPVNFKASVGAKASQAWKYPGYNILRAPGGCVVYLPDCQIVVTPIFSPRRWNTLAPHARDPLDSIDHSHEPYTRDSSTPVSK